jgi:hypothetical protein
MIPKSPWISMWIPLQFNRLKGYLKKGESKQDLGVLKIEIESEIREMSHQTHSND